MTITEDVRTFSREEFYDLVWSAPATKLAGELSCSDVMIAKICRKYKIPKPYSGYWAKKAHGKDAPKPSLPDFDDPNRQTIKIYIHPEFDSTVDEPPRELKYDSDILETLRKAKHLGDVVVSKALRNPHPLVAVTRDKLNRDREQAKLPWNERTYGSERPKTLDISTSEALASRALRIMDALLRRWEKLGGEVELHDRGTFLNLAGEQVTRIRLREKCNQVRINDPKAKYSWDRNRMELIPSGLLLLDSGPSSYLCNFPKDTKRKPLEGALGRFVVELVVKAADQRVRIREREENERVRQEQERIRIKRENEIRELREEFEKRKAAEQAKVEELVYHAEAWKKCKMVREYLSELSTFLKPGNTKLEAYLKWGHEQADRMDPLRESPPSLLDEKFDAEKLMRDKPK